MVDRILVTGGTLKIIFELQQTQQPPAKAGGLDLWTESPDTGQRPVYSSARKLSSTLASK